MKKTAKSSPFLVRVGLPGLAATMGAVLVALFLIDAPSNPSPNAAIGKPAPQLDLVELSPGVKAVPAELPATGKVTLLHLWGTWCRPCRMEYPHLSEMANEYSKQNQFQFVPVSCEAGSGETFVGLWEKTSRYFDSENVTSVAYADPRGITRTSLVERLDQHDLYFPTSIVIGPDGNIAGVWEGYSETAIGEISTLVDSLLDQ